ncbi:MAG: alkyl sulfatase C-terminal domain-containing protein [Actinomycetes bacterium]
MATVQQCRAALVQLAVTMSEADEQTGNNLLERTLSVTLTDLGVTFSGRLRGGLLTEVATDPAPPAQIRVTTTSDDLVALTSGTLDFARAWASGRLRVRGTLADLLRLRTLL